MSARIAERHAPPSLCVPQESVSEQSERFFVAELVREQIFLQYHQEIPYSTAVTPPLAQHESCTCLCAR